MGDVVILLIIQNILIFCVIFWALTILGGFFYKKKDHTSKKQFYECGFKSLTDSTINININFTLVCIFLVLYDVEFTLLFPILFNLSLISFYQIIIFYIFISLIFGALYYDWLLNAMNWQY